MNWIKQLLICSWHGHISNIVPISAETLAGTVVIGHSRVCSRCNKTIEWNLPIK